MATASLLEHAPATRSGPALPRRRPELILTPVGSDGRVVVKDRRNGRYFQLGEEETFLLQSLDGEATADDVLDAFATRFGDPLSPEDLDDFLELARSRDLVEPARTLADGSAFRDELLSALCRWPIPGAGAETLPASPDAPRSAPVGNQDDDEEDDEGEQAGSGRTSFNPLYVKIRLINPERIFDWLEPRLRLVWTRGFVAVTLVIIALAGLLAWAERDAFLDRINDGLTWRTVLLAWGVLAVTTTAHEFAHGLTCRHFGGEVRDVGFLLMYFMPCFYANVSDAWLFSERWKRLAVTLAGGYCDLVLWSLGLFAWRLAQPGTVAHDMAFFVSTICGVRVIFNLNPLLKLDGYYLLADAIDMPNLRRRGLERFKAQARRLLWGAAAPSPDDRGLLLTAYGAACWSFSVMFLAAMVYGVSRYLATSSVMALSWTAFLAVLSGRRLLVGFFQGEVRAMIRKRRGRAAIMVLGGILALATLAVCPVEDRAGGTFVIRPAVGGRAEIRARIAGFLREVSGDEGTPIQKGGKVARLDAPGLSSRLLQKQAEVRESEAKLALLRVGSRPEQIAEQRARVDRSRRWRDLARDELTRMRAAYVAELAEIEAEARQLRAELDRAKQSLQRDRALFHRQALQVDALRETEKLARVAEAKSEALEARRSARSARGVLEAEGELARRETQLADDESTLRLLEAGSRPEEIDAEAARLSRLEEELRELRDKESRLDSLSPVAGVIGTPRLAERIGQYFQEGELIAEVETTARVEAEVAINEQDVPKVRPGQAVALKVRALPFETFKTRVDRVAPVASRATGRPAFPNDPRSPNNTAAASPSSSSSRDAAGTFIVYCAFDDEGDVLRTGMTGYARVWLGTKPLGLILAHRVLRFVRTEFWW